MPTFSANIDLGHLMILVGYIATAIGFVFGLRGQVRPASIGTYNLAMRRYRSIDKVALGRRMAIRFYWMWRVTRTPRCAVEHEK